MVSTARPVPALPGRTSDPGLGPGIRGLRSILSWAAGDSTGVPSNELLDRLDRAPHASDFVLKSELLFGARYVRRTRREDGDLLPGEQEVAVRILSARQKSPGENEFSPGLLSLLGTTRVHARPNTFNTRTNPTSVSCANRNPSATATIPPAAICASHQSSTKPGAHPPVVKP